MNLRQPEAQVFEPLTHSETICDPTHIIALDFPEQEPNLNTIKFIDDTGELSLVLTDASKFPGGSTDGMFKFSDEANASEVSYVVRQCSESNKSIVAIGSQTSLTGAAVPREDVVLNMYNRKKTSEVIRNNEGNYITVQTGVTISELQEVLEPEGLFFPSAPTYTDATVIGSISTDAGGARSYKYGKTRNYVEALNMVLPSGEVLDISRGQFIAHPGDEESPGGYFILEGKEDSRRISIPTYNMPNVPKVSAGYYAKPDMDLIDLIIGSEGTLGIITEATIKVIEEPPTSMALVQCDSDKQAFDFISILSSQTPCENATFDLNRISAVEYMGSKSVALIREKSDTPTPENGVSFLLVQIEGDEEDILEEFMELCDANGINDFYPANASETKQKDYFIEVREAVPITVNNEIAVLKQGDSKVTKVGADPCVNPRDLLDMMRIYDEEFSKVGINYFDWGHGEGNIHFNALPVSAEEAVRAKGATLEAGIRVINELSGTGTAEHGVGKNIIKQLLLLALYKEEGIAEMRALKLGFDPKGILNPNTMFSLAV